MRKETKPNIKSENQSIGGLDMSKRENSLIIVTTPTITGYGILKILGPVHGLTVKTKGVGGKIVAGIEGIFGGEVPSTRQSVRRLEANP